MKKTLTTFITGFGLVSSLVFAGTASDERAEQSDSASVTLEGVSDYTLRSQTLDTNLHVYVIKPDTKEPPEGFPVVYAFDADLNLGLMTTMARKVSRIATQKTNLRPPIVVAIGYGDMKVAIQRRLTDLTPLADDYVLPERPNGKPWAKVGGGDRLLESLITEIKPFVESRYKIDTSMETLYGHSLGGLLTLHALLSKTDHFDRYAAASPSLWFNQRKTMWDLIDFHQNPKKQKPAPGIPLRLSVGGNEESLTGWSMLYDKNPEFRKKWLQHNKMVSNATQLYNTLKAHEGKVAIEFTVYEGMEHALANAPAFFDALQYAIEPDKP